MSQETNDNDLVPVTVTIAPITERVSVRIPVHRWALRYGGRTLHTEISERIGDHIDFDFEPPDENTEAWQQAEPVR